MTKNEALKLALEALECALSDDRPYIVQCKEAITAIKEALAQPEYQSTADKSKLEKVPAKGTLLAHQCVCGEPNSAGTHRTDGPCLAPQRTWVGLTEKDFSAINQSCLTKLQAATSAESILKEKNT